MKMCLDAHTSPGGSIPQQIYLENLYCLENPFNPPPPRVLVQGDKSPATYRASPGGSIPHYPESKYRGINPSTNYLENFYCLENPFNPPPPRVLVQGDQSPTIQVCCPGGSRIP